MKDYHQEYFYMNSVGNHYPRLEYTGSQPIKNSQLLYTKKQVDDTQVIPLKYGEPLPRKPKLADVHHLEVYLAISEGFKKHMEQLVLKNVQFIPATIQDSSDEVHNGYYIIHVHNVIRCADLDKSEWTPFIRNPEQVQSFDKLVLNNETLDRIPLKDRLVIAIEEKITYHIYHRSVVDHLLKYRPTGVMFYRLGEFTGREPFEDEFLEYIKE